MFETVWDVCAFSRGLFGKKSDPALIEKILRQLSLWDKKGDEIRTLSGGMKRRVLIAKALVHEPSILFLDEPTAGVDVNLRKEMWEMVRELRKSGVTIILTTHYIEEAQEMADRIGVINDGQIIVVEEKETLMRKLGKKQVSFQLASPLKAVPHGLSDYQLDLEDQGNSLTYTYDTQTGSSNISLFIKKLNDEGLHFRDLVSRESSLEDIFIGLVQKK